LATLRLRNGFFLVTLLLAAALALPRVLPVNMDSRRLLARQLAARPGQIPAADLPAGRPRSEAWLAVWLYRDGLDAELIERLSPVEAIPDTFTQRIAAQAYERLGDYASAVALLGPIGNVDQLLATAETAGKAGALDAAEQAYRFAFEIDPIKATSPLADFLLDARQDPEAAAALLQQAVDLTDNHRLTPYWLIRLAGILETAGRWDEAAEAHAAAIDKNSLMYPGEQQLSRRYVDLAWALHMAGRPGEAVAALEQGAALIAPEDSRWVYFWERAGQIYEAAGSPSMAADAYNRVLVQDPDNETALAGLERLAGSGDK